MNNENALPQPLPDAILSQMLFASLIQKGIFVMAKAGIPDLLAQEPRTAEEIAEKIGIHTPSLYRVLRTLSSAGIFAENG